MVQIRTGAGVTALSGSISGNVCSRNRSGAYMRAGTKPTNVRSSALCRSRSILSILTKKWSNTLTAEQRIAWETYAKAIVSRNALGESIHLTGQLMFIRTNQSRISASLGVCLSAPTVLELGGKDPILKISGETPPVLAVEFDDTLPWCSEDGAALIVHAGRPQKSTLNFYNGPWLYAGKISGNSATPPTSPAVITSESQIQPEQKLFAKSIITRADGRCSNQQNLSPKIYTAYERFLTLDVPTTHKLRVHTLTGSYITSFNDPNWCARVHHDPLTNKLWIVCTITNHIYYCELVGSAIVVLQDGHISGFVNAIDGACVDTRDASLWVNYNSGGANDRIWHVTRTINGASEHTILASLNIDAYCPNPMDVAFDSTDNTLWVTEGPLKKIYHVNPSDGSQIGSAIDLVAAGCVIPHYSPGVEFDYSTGHLFVACDQKGVYEMTREGQLVQLISTPGHVSGPWSVTKAPLSIFQ